MKPKRLNPQQAAIAAQIAAYARGQGIPPIAAVSSAWQQTGFKQPPAGVAASFSAAGRQHPLPTQQLANVSPAGQRAAAKPRRGQVRLGTRPQLRTTPRGAGYSFLQEFQRQLLAAR